MTDTPIPCPFCGDPMQFWGDGTHVSHIGTDESCPVWHLGIFVGKWNHRAPIRIKTLKWRELDPGRCYVGTGIGFTCEVRLMHSGIWETTLPTGKIDTLTCSGAMLAAREAYFEMVRSHLETP